MPSEMMIRRLRVNSKLSEDDVSALRSMRVQVKEFAEETVVVHEGERATHCCVILSGFAYRAKVAENGKRQILSFHPAGDMPDLQGLFLDRMDHDIVTLSRARLGFIEHRAVHQLIEARPSIVQALWRETLVDAAVFREWIVSLGTRTAAGRMAHLIAELRQRLTAIGLAADDEFEFPITQSRLAEALGLSAVHVNRVLQSFRAEGVLDIQKNMVKLSDIEKLVEIGGFNDTYLHQQ
ncbi:Crp/Fnr family transcriptional regulator [Bradyrhizobium sp. BRP22]|uniref:Crp/Fnr family transcriptional regulator n=1 Tax=Bradyrhizobium sp. BRP22 TaxID=2793821 RepID=UPI001CD37C83|nr:Crp/Fnr family transcriptional regulator [Bradyrhizobium sp. BRP22]